MRIRQLVGSYAIVRLPPDSPFPEWAGGDFLSVTRTSAELSLVVGEDLVPGGVRVEGGWRLFELDGPLEFSAVGVLASITEPLAAGGISLFAISTFDTDYFLVREERLEAATDVLESAGHQLLGPSD